MRWVVPCDLVTFAGPADDPHFFAFAVLKVSAVAFTCPARFDLVDMLNAAAWAEDEHVERCDVRRDRLSCQNRRRLGILHLAQKH